MMQVSNLWGGLLYLVVPPKTQVKGLQAQVQMAVPAPYYKSGKCVVVRKGLHPYDSSNSGVPITAMTTDV